MVMKVSSREKKDVTRMGAHHAFRDLIPWMLGFVPPKKVQILKNLGLQQVVSQEPATALVVCFRDLLRTSFSNFYTVYIYIYESIFYRKAGMP